MSLERTSRCFRFGPFEADSATGELRRQGIRVRLSAQPFRFLMLLLDQPGELVPREAIQRALWPDGTFTDYEHGVNSALNRLREALGDSATHPRYVETLARRGYRFLAPVTVIANGNGAAPDPAPEVEEISAAPLEAAVSLALASPSELPRSSHRVVKTLFILLQLMYAAFYVGALANLPEIADLMSPLPPRLHALTVLIVTAAVMVPVRAFAVFLVTFRAPGACEKFLRLWPVLLLADLLWSLAPFLLLHHINAGVSLLATALLVYAPFAQRSLMLMGAGEPVE